MTGGQQVGALVPHQGGEPVGGAGGEQHPRRGVSAAGPGQPLRGGEAQLAGDGLGQGQVVEGVVADQRPQRQGSVLPRLHEEALAGQAVDQRARLGDADGVAEVGGELVEDRQPADRLPHRRRLMGEDLLGQVREQRGPGAIEPVEHRRPARPRGLPQGLDGQDDGRRPAPGQPVETLGQLDQPHPQPLPHQLPDLLGGEGELLAAELEQLSLPAEPLDREERTAAPRQHQVEPGRRVTAEGLDEARRGVRRAQLVNVVDDQDEVAVDVSVHHLGQP